MSLTTLTSLKVELGIPTTDTSEDAYLTAQIRKCSAAIRRYTRRSFLGGLIQSATLANPTIVTAPGHGLKTGNVILLGGTNTTPSLDGLQTVTRIDDDTFSIPVNVTVAGTKGYYAKQFTEFYAGTGARFLILNNRPVHSITSLYLDPSGYYGDGPDAFGASTLLVAGTDYELVKDNANETEKSLRGFLARISDYWPRPGQRTAGLLADTAGQALGNIKVTYVAGYFPVEPDLSFACEQAIKLVRSMGERGRSLSSESDGYYSYTIEPASDKANRFGEIRSLLSSYRAIV
jgi:hypothetical protein